MTETKLSFRKTHPPEDCAGRRWCPIHNTSPEAEAIGPQHWRSDRGIMERICVHGVGHYDWDQWEYHKSIGAEWESVHGCDFCCREHEKAVVS